MGEKKYEKTCENAHKHVGKGVRPDGWKKHPKTRKISSKSENKRAPNTKTSECWGKRAQTWKQIGAKGNENRKQMRTKTKAEVSEKNKHEVWNSKNRNGLNKIT